MTDMTLFGTTATGAPVYKITLSDGDLSVDLLTLGSRIHDVRLAGVGHALTVGGNDVSDYEGAMQYHGAIVGPIANRISNARVRLDSMMYELERNEDGARHLHSGSGGSHAQIWEIAQQTDTSATLMLAMADGQAGLPGNRTIMATFAITAPATLTLTVTGRSDTTTLMNFANHSYWNLDGTDQWMGHQLRIAADHYLPIDAATCPTGDIADVTGTAMDFRTGTVLDHGTPALDHNFCLSDGRVLLREVLWLTGQRGVMLTMATTEPGLQIFDGRPDHNALAIEAQCWPDAPNNPAFPSIKYRPDATYQQITSWTFGAA